MIHQSKLNDNQHLRIEILGENLTENEERLVEKCLIFLTAVLGLKNEKLLNKAILLLNTCIAVTGEIISSLMFEEDAND